MRRHLITTLDDCIRAWVKKHRRDPAVLAWLEANPPPENWGGTRLEWAFTEMPVGLFSKKPGRIL